MVVPGFNVQSLPDVQSSIPRLEAYDPDSNQPGARVLPGACELS